MNKNWVNPKNNLAIEIKSLSKSYEGISSNEVALDNISLNIKCGSFFGLLGPNGAGKSTLINIIGGTVIKSSGYVKVWDIDIDKHRKQSKLAIGIVPQELNFDAFFTPKEQLELQAGLFNVPKKDRITDEILDLMELTSKANAYSRTLSGGMRRRLLVAKAMIHNPPIIILDEPTAGVDVELRKKLWDNFKKLNSLGVTVILTTHYLEEAETLCDEIAIIHKGKIITKGPKKSLLSKIDKKIITIKHKTKLSSRMVDFLKTLGDVKFTKKRCEISYAPSKISIDHIINYFKKSKIEILDLKTRDVKLEDVFLMLTKE